MEDSALTPKIKSLDAAFGIEVLGIDLAKATPADCKWILKALAEYAVLVFRRQKLDAKKIAEFGRKIGEPRPHILLNYRVPGHPEVSMLTNVDSEGKVDPFGVSRAAAWHSDMTYRKQLPVLAMLHSLEIPSNKGGTIFADMRAAHDTLSDDVKSRLAGMTAIHGDATGPAGYRKETIESEPAHEAGDAEAHHPAIRVHPVNRRKILFVNPMHTTGFEGVEEKEGVEMIEWLAEHSTQSEFLYYHQWEVGDVVIWDEASTMHRNAGDYDPSERRIFVRTIVF